MSHRETKRLHWSYCIEATIVGTYLPANHEIIVREMNWVVPKERLAGVESYCKSKIKQKIDISVHLVFLDLLLHISLFIRFCFFTT